MAKYGSSSNGKIGVKGNPSAASATGTPGSSVKSTRVIRGRGTTAKQGGSRQR